jgi:hypothetical protein
MNWRIGVLEARATFVNIFTDVLCIYMCIDANGIIDLSRSQILSVPQLLLCM